MISLYKHNEDGYDSLNSMLENSRFAAINHATGTGKSFIILKYLFNNKNKKYLYIAPTYEIIDQFINRDRQKAGINEDDISVDCLIYRSLLDCDIEELYQKYDGFILDEYHRAGATKTFEQISKLKDLIKNGTADKELIGLTATSIRYLDQERNMTDELFEGNIASNISLAEAIVEGILPVPRYIIRSSQLEKEYQKTLNRINQLYPSEIKKRYIEELKKMEKVTVKADDLTTIFSNNMPKNGNYIFFSSTIKNLQDAMDEAPTWFQNFPELNLYCVHSEMKKSEIKKQIEAFDNTDTGLNIMFAVDLFSEGVHPKKVDGVILNRKTTSPIIYFQQMGRTLTAANINKTVQVFDLQSNYVSHYAIQKLYEDITELAQKKIKENPQDKDKYLDIINAFQVIDTSTDYINRLTSIRKEITREVIISSKIDFIITSLENYIINKNLSGKQLSGIDIDNNKVKKLYYELYKYRDLISPTQQAKLTSLQVIMPTTPYLTKEEIINNKVQRFIDLLIEYLKDNNIQNILITQYSIEDEELKKLYYEIIANAKYITIDQMLKLQALNVVLPDYLMVSKEERERHLEGYENEYQLTKSQNRKRKKRVLEYLKNNSITIDSELFNDYLNILLFGDQTTKNKIKELVNINELPLWTKLLLDIELTEEEQLLFYEECLKTYKNNHTIPNYYEKALRVLNNKYGFGRELLNKLKQDKKDNNTKSINLIDILNYINTYPNLIDIEEDKTYQEMYQVLSMEEQEKVTQYLKGLIQQNNTTMITNLIPNQSMKDTIILMKSCDIDNLFLLKAKLEEQYDKLSLLNEYIDIQLTESNPNNSYTIASFTDVLTEEELTYLINNDIRRLKLSISKTQSELNLKIALCDYVLFCLSNKRRPISQTDDREIELFNMYNTIRRRISKTNFTLINNYLNTPEIIKGTEKQIVINAKKR